MPTWPLRTKKQEHFNAGVLFKAKRPTNKPQTRYHAGVDLSASLNDEVLAPEDMIIVDADRGWEETVVATLAHTASGKAIIFGGLKKGTSLPKNTMLKAGQPFARIGAYPKGSTMLHFQLYDALISPAEANHTQSWYVNTPKPAHLTDPMPYLTSLMQGHEDQQVPADDDPIRTEQSPCVRVNGSLACMLPDIDFWRAQLVSVVKLAQAAKAAMEGSFQQGAAYPENQAVQINLALDHVEEAYHVSLADAAGEYDGEGANSRVIRLVTQVQRAGDAAAVLGALLKLPTPTPAPHTPSPSPAPSPGAPDSGSGAGMALAIGGLVVAGIATFFVLKKKRR